jgi:single-strand DNA-binding protein
MANFNKVFLMGNLTRDPQLSYLPSQTPVVDFGLAVNRRWTGKDGEARDETCFVDCRAFGRLAENINKYMRKGRPIFVEGRLVFEQWTAQDGSKRSKHRVHVDNFQFLGAPASAGAEAPADGQPMPNDIGQQEPPNPPAGRAGTTPKSEDDIPF